MPVKTSPINCQWHECGGLAAADVRLGWPMCDMKDGPCRVAISSRPNHVDLCPEHIQATRPSYHDIALNSVGECPVSGCG